MFFSFSFCPADSVIVATAPLADSVIVAPLADICFPNPHSQKYMFTKSLPVTNS